MDEFTAHVQTEMRNKGLEMQKLLLERIEVNEAHVADFETRLQEIERNIERIGDRIEQEYRDFIASRRRWKSDFELAADKSKSNIE